MPAVLVFREASASSEIRATFGRKGQRWLLSGHRARMLRLVDSCITQLKAQGPARTCNESKEEEEEGHRDFEVREFEDAARGRARCSARSHHLLPFGGAQALAGRATPGPPYHSHARRRKRGRTPRPTPSPPSAAHASALAPTTTCRFWLWEWVLGSVSFLFYFYFGFRVQGQGFRVHNLGCREEGSYLRRIDFVYHSTLGLRVIKKKKV